MHFTDENIDQFFNHGFSVPTRTIYVGSCYHNEEEGVEEVEESGTEYKMAEKLIKALHVLNSIGDSPISIIMNNIGGDVYHGLAMYDAIVTSTSSTIVTILGHAQSMGSWILQAGSTRRMHKNATMLLHYGEITFEGHELDLIKFAEERARLNTLMEEMYLDKIRKKHRNYPKERLQQLINFDKYLTAQGAVDLGLADEVI